MYRHFYGGIPFFALIDKETSENELFFPTSDKVSIFENLKVKNAEYFEITKLRIKQAEEEIYTISANIENSSEKSYNNVIFRISFYDTEKELITALDYKLDSIEGKGSISTFATIRRDLSTCEYYSVALKK